MSFTSSANFKQTLIQEASGSLTLFGSGSTGRTDIFTVNGNNGTLFSVSDDLSDSLFSVNTVAGLPVIEAFADNTVKLGKFGAEAIVISGSNNTLQLSGSIKAVSLGSTSDTNVVVFNTSTKALSYNTALSLQGATGTQGTAGSTGTQGTAGSTGTQGTAGTNGTQGTTGAQGAVGSQGTAGTNGTQGTTGTQGAIGAQGVVGAQGTTGTGTQGAVGTQGNVGGTGTQGAVGTQGNVGGTGAQGAVGTQGNVGGTGAQGAVGTQGNVGGTGAQGTTGTQGATGGTGGTGTQGAVGTQGNVGGTGTQGATGAQGNTGGTGAQGATGGTGTQGTTGAQGTTGTATQGTTGAQGAVGTATQGTTGAQGTTGTQGAVGTATQGTTGTQGIQGISGGGGSIPGSNNEMLTSDGAGAAVAESNLTFDGSTLTLVSSTEINGNSGTLRWQSGNTFYGGGVDINLISGGPVIRQGVSSVNRYADLQNWTDQVYFNGLIIGEADVSAVSSVTPGQLLHLTTNNNWEPADADTQTATKLLGICVESAGAEGVTTVLLNGIYSTTYHDQFGGTAPSGRPLYVSTTNTGYVTEIAPTGSGRFVRLIGHNIYDASDKIIVRFDPDNTWIAL